MLLNANVISTIAKAVLGKDYEIETKESESSNSVYLKIIYGGVDTSLRFSDHYTNKSKVKTIIVKERTKKSLIEKSIIKSAVNLKRLSLSLRLGMAESIRKQID